MSSENLSSPKEPILSNRHIAQRARRAAERNAQGVHPQLSVHQSRLERILASQANAGGIQAPEMGIGPSTEIGVSPSTEIGPSTETCPSEHSPRLDGDQHCLGKLSNRQLAQRARREREAEINLNSQPSVKRSRLERILSLQVNQSNPLCLFRDEIAPLEIRAREMGAGTSTDAGPSTETGSDMHSTPGDLIARHSPLADHLYEGQQQFLTTTLRRRMVQRIRRPVTETQQIAQQLSSIPEDNETVSQITLQNDSTGVDDVLQSEIIGRHYIGRMDIECKNCKALHWIDERLSASSPNKPLFGSCCLQGQIKLPLLRRPPDALAMLYDGNTALARKFRKHIRGFNAAFAFTSLGVRRDDRDMGGRGLKAFTIMGELRHRTGALLPEEGREASYSQLYIYDPAIALQLRQNRNPHLDADVLQIIQKIMDRDNPFASDYRYAHDILQTEALDPNRCQADIHAYLRYTSDQDRRRYNLPSDKEIAVIIPGDGTEHTASRDIVLYLKSGNGLLQINECNPTYLPLHYVLFFPYGELGWSTTLTHSTTPATDRRENTSTSRTRLTQLEFYCYRLFQRHSEYSSILRGCNLFQEFLCDAWASTEQNRLRYIILNQTKIRSELYKGLTDVAGSGLAPDQIGQRIILPSSHTCSPRYYFEILQDSLAITRFNKHPDVFLTMTANPKWPEITESLMPNQVAHDRPDLVARVFELKRKALMNEICRNDVFGKKVAHVYTIEFQKRGLPHMHALFYLQHEDKIKTADQVDHIITAEFPDPEADSTLFQTVMTCMIHGPCGIRNPRAPCMEGGICTKRYPKEMVTTTTMDRDGYPIYRRRDNNLSYDKNGIQVDNRDVVPYNPYLTRMFNCHINVEVCAGIRCVKYIHKYIFKGHDRTTLVLNRANEVQQYLDSRYIGSPEAAWRLFENSMHEEVPNVVRLVVHLPGMHRVTYNADDTMENILRRAEIQDTTLTAFFECCRTDARARECTYQEMPQHYTWKKPSWFIRRRGFAIGRMYFVPPNAGENFYLRLLLTVVTGPTSFDDLRTFDNVLFPTFRETCIARGLLEDDQEWVQCLQEAAIMQSGYQLRRLFCIILSKCKPTKPELLWDTFAENICDDLLHNLRNSFGIPNPTQTQTRDYGLHMLNDLLSEYGQSLKDFPDMPLPLLNWDVVGANKLMLEHNQFVPEAQLQISIDNSFLFNEQQSEAHQKVVDSVINGDGKIFFLSGPAGTGKTFVYNTIAATCRSRGYIVIMVASSGIAALLLSSGRTAHSTFKIPLDILNDSVCGFNKQSQHAELFRNTKLIIWDEVTMQHKYGIEAVDRAMRDICDNEHSFGGITVVFGGDFRQCLPVVPKGVREQIVAASLRRSYIWTYVHVLILTQNMRLDNNDPDSVQFAQTLKEIGTDPLEVVKLPSTINYSYNIGDLLAATYPRLNEIDVVTSIYLMDRLILAARNDDVSLINSAALAIFPGETYTYFAADKMAEADANNPANINQFPNEYLNTLQPAGIPPFVLQLKVGSPIMLLRNLAPKDGMCNGTRLRVDCCMSRCIKATLLTGTNAGKSVFIPRISLTPSTSDFPFKMTRRQFPVRLAYAITINKSQGQSVKHVGIDLHQEVFSHGQLYVALSRCTLASRINILLPQNADRSTKNIVFPEVLI